MSNSCRKFQIVYVYITYASKCSRIMNVKTLLWKIIMQRRYTDCYWCTVSRSSLLERRGHLKRNYFVSIAFLVLLYLNFVNDIFLQMKKSAAYKFSEYSHETD